MSPSQPSGFTEVTVFTVRRDVRALGYIDFVTTPGVAQDVRGPNGKTIKLTQRFAQGALVQVGVGPRGTTRSTLKLSADSRTLTYESVMTSSLLSSPIGFTLVYARHGE